MKAKRRIENGIEKISMCINFNVFSFRAECLAFNEPDSMLGSFVDATAKSGPPPRLYSNDLKYRTLDDNCPKADVESDKEHSEIECSLP